MGQQFKDGAGCQFFPQGTFALWGDSTNGYGIYGTSQYSYGVEGQSHDGIGVFGTSFDYAVGGWGAMSVSGRTTSGLAGGTMRTSPGGALRAGSAAMLS